MLILSLAFLGLWIIGLFSADRTAGIHMALIVSLLFFCRSLMTIEVDFQRSKKDQKLIDN